MPVNTLESKPRFTVHRDEQGTPVIADSATLTTLPKQAALNVDEWETIEGFVKLDGGASPTVTLVPLMLAKWTDETTVPPTEHEELVVQGAASGALADGDSFSFNVKRGLAFLRISAVANAPTHVRVLVGGANRQLW